MSARIIELDPMARAAANVIAGAVTAGNPGVSDVDAEEMLMAAIAMCDVPVGAVSDILTDHRAFSRPQLANWYEAALAIEAEGGDVDLGRLLAWLGAKHGKGKASELIRTYRCDMLETYERVRSLTADTARIRAAAIRDCWLKRRMGHLAIEAEAMAYSAETTLEELEERLRLGMEAILADRQGGSSSISGMDLAKAAARAMKAPPTGVPLGLPKLTRMLCGLRAQETSIIAARTSVGKSMLAMQVSVWAAKRGHGVSYWSGEMAPPILGSRMVSHIGQVNGRFAQGEPLTVPEQQRILPAMNTLAALPIKVHPSMTATIADVARVAKQHAMEFRNSDRRLDLLVVDHIGLVKPSTTAARLSKREQVGIVSRALREMAEKLNCHVVGLAQINREAEKVEGPPKMSMLRDSGDIEQDADNIILVHRTRDKDGSFIRDIPAQLIVAKNRVAGLLGCVEADCDDQYQTFTEVE